MIYDNHLSLKPVDYLLMGISDSLSIKLQLMDDDEILFSLDLFHSLHKHTRLAESKNHKLFYSMCKFVDCTPFSSVWYQIISKQRAPSILCCTRFHRDSFHKTFMRSASLFASIGVSVWVLALTKGHYWFLHLFSTRLSSFSPSQWQTFCGEKKVSLDCFCSTIAFIKLS